MSHGFQPEGESVRQALRWIGEQRKLDPSRRVGKLIEEASLKFDLTPAESDWLWRTFLSPPPQE